MRGKALCSNYTDYKSYQTKLNNALGQRGYFQENARKSTMIGLLKNTNN